MTVVAQVSNLRKTFGSIEAVCDLSFAVKEGEVFGLIGPNGSGKTTTLRTLLGFYRPDGGSVRVLGWDPFTEFDRIGGGVGVMLEQPGLCSHLTASEYLDFYAGLLGIKRPEATQARDQALRAVGLSDRRRDLLGGFSKGMSQRVSLARCLLNRPRLLVLDEPFDGVDVESRSEMRESLVRLAREGMCILVTSHNLNELERICTKVAIIAAGRVVGIDSPRGFEEAARGGTNLLIVLGGTPDCALISRLWPDATYDPVHQEVTLKLEGQTRESVLRTLLDHQLSIVSMRETGRSLEDAYLRLTSPGEFQ